MPTLKQLIDGGLKVGQLVNVYTIEGVLIFTMQYDADVMYFIKTYKAENSRTHCSLNSFLGALSRMPTYCELTTAHDSGISPDILPVPEPFATGWCVTSDGYKFEPIPYKKPSNLFTDGWHRDFLKSECRPCLPPL